MKLTPSLTSRRFCGPFVIVFGLGLDLLVYFPWIILIVINEFCQDNEEFIDEGVPLEPFNLEQEREEGYFDDNGNYVEYVNKQIKVL